MVLIRRYRDLARDPLRAADKGHVNATRAIKDRFLDRGSESSLFRELLKEVLQVLVLLTAPTRLHGFFSSGWRFSLGFNLHVGSCRRWNRSVPRNRNRFVL